jgi:hypothetical protein
VKVAGVIAAVLLVTGAGLRPLREALQPPAAGPAAGTDAHPAAIVGQGLSLAALGGSRALAADLLWLKAYLAWAACDLPATQALIRLVTIVDERPLCFWLNGARMIAYDMPRWRLDRAGQNGPAPAEVRRRIFEEQAAAALSHLQDAARCHLGSAAICVEIANIHLYCRSDIASAACWYRKAAELPGAPYYTARVYAELLKRLGRPREAYAWLRRVHPTLPPNDADAMAGMVLDRIRNLECLLEVPETERYVAPTAADRRPAGG